ncbi:AI-2E family transporter [Hymenobacter arizonensis]|uniref:Predicted PurR-regulated permease PerM n=1 Tax=Hymenobacter arizonensis TaxID=1227077 RepID=A0A1I5U871_HYMAR|nr:AI-2E family transporter [Hymenobacter arizonensis]SFP91432.1 Predicted PurR-regulated permease PerM [Hymenobacter arizonensis]
MFPPLANRGTPHSNVSQQSGSVPEARLAPVIHYTFLLIGLSLLVYVLHKLDGILLPLFFAALLSTLLLPMVSKLEDRGWPRILAIITAILLLVGGIVGLGVVFGAQIMDLKAELPLIQQKLVVFMDQGQQWLHDRLGMRIMSKDEIIDSSLSSAKKSAGGFLGSTLSTTAGVLSVLTLIPIYIFCFLYYRDHMRQFMFRFVSPDKRTAVLHTMDSIQTVVQAYITGLLMVIVIVAVLNGIGLLLLGVKFAIFFAIFASVLAVIPYIGILVGATIPALITLVETGSPGKAAAVVGVFVFVQFLEGNFITPMITGSKVSINPMAAIVALILGGELWGTPGMILSIPLVAVLKVVFDSNKATEPWGFLLGDVTDGEDTKKDKSDDKPGFFGKAWHMLKRI